MEILTIIFFSVIIIYSIFIVWISYGFDKVKAFHPIALEPKTQFSIIIPIRNEEENLPNLLYSFSQLNYPRDLFEVIFVNDSSEDDSVATIKNFPVLSFPFQIIDTIRKSNSPKKDAISTAMQSIKSEWIVTTDADCLVHPDWLLTLDHYIQENNCEMICGAVSYDAKSSFLHQFQQLDLMSLQGATIGTFGIGKGFMCNGANFAYTKNLFLDLKGFDGNDKIASGDDVFLLQKAIGKIPEKVYYLKSDANIVLTKPLDSWKSLFYQRVRWASKTSSYESSFGKILALVVFAGNFITVLGLLLAIFGLFSFWNWYLLFTIKIFTDFLLLYQTGKFIRSSSAQSALFFILSSLVYPFFSTAVAFYSLIGKYEWKGRRL